VAEGGIMNICSCGNVAVENSNRCVRCAAFDALELKPDATTDEIHHAFEVLSRTWNPSRYQDDPKMKAIAEGRLKVIDAAHTLLVRGSVQAAPFRSAATGARVETPIDVALDDNSPEAARLAPNRSADKAAAKRFRVPLPLLIGGGVVVAGAVMAWILFEPIDSALMGVPVAGKIYADYKAGIRSHFQELKNKAGLGVGSTAPAPQEETTTASGPNAPAQTVATNAPPAQRPQNPASHGGATALVRGSIAHEHALPFITAGLSRDEVIAAEGAPTAETPDEMDYGNSKIYFANGVVIGWRIDPSSPIRVKLWPDASVDPDLQAFGINSTRNEVIVAQGTPTTYSPSTWAYGKSEVYFQYGRVVGWKNDAATPLRTTSR
jgi:hypothetical protein